MSRLRRLNNKVIDMICDAISVGSSRELAAKYAAVSESAFMLWMKLGREELERIQNGEPATPERKLHLKLLERVEGAQAQAGVGWVQVISRAADTDPNWARWMLEVHFPEQYSRKLRIAGEGEGGAININVYEQTWERRWREAHEAITLLDETEGAAAGDGDEASE